MQYILLRNPPAPVLKARDEQFIHWLVRFLKWLLEIQLSFINRTMFGSESCFKTIILLFTYAARYYSIGIFANTCFITSSMFMSMMQGKENKKQSLSWGRSLQRAIDTAGKSKKKTSKVLPVLQKEENQHVTMRSWNAICPRKAILQGKAIAIYLVLKSKVRNVQGNYFVSSFNILYL